MDDSIKKYDKISRSSLNVRPKEIRAYIPKLTDLDYTRGYLYRYFVRKSNDMSSPIFEVSPKDYSNLINNPFYVGAKVRWRLTGEMNEVRESNRIAVNLASEKIKNLKLYLPNLSQFHK
jgi:hypothetical protein